MHKRCYQFSTSESRDEMPGSFMQRLKKKRYNIIKTSVKGTGNGKKQIL